MSPTKSIPGVRPLGLLVRGVVGIATVAAAIGVFTLLYSTRPETPRQQEGERSLTVRTVTAALEQTAPSWRGYGAAEARHAADIASEVTALVLDRPEDIEAGASIKRGETIVRLDDAQYRQRHARAIETINVLNARLETLEAELSSIERSLELAERATELMKWELERLQEAEQQGAAGPAEINRLMRQLTQTQREEEALRERFDQIVPRRKELRSQIAVEEANARLAEIDVERCRITSPIDGRIQRVHVKEGERLSPGGPVARVVNLEQMETPLRAPASAAGELEIGDRIELVADGPGGRTWPAVLSRIAPEADQQTRTITIYAETQQDPHADRRTLLLPGQFVTARIFKASPKQRIPVPRAALRKDGVMVIDEQGRARRRRVEVSHYFEADLPRFDPAERQWAAIETGLSPGDRVIISNLDELAAGQPVSAVDEASEGSLVSNGRDLEPKE